MTLPLYVYVFLAMLRFAPVERLPQYPGHTESWRESLARYGEIAAAITTVCDSASMGERECAAVLIAIGVGESHFARDADIGPCYRPKGSALRNRCGGGHAASVWQCEAFGSDEYGPITRRRLFADRVLAARRSLTGAMQCRNSFAGLAGSCNPSKAHREAAAKHRARYWRVLAWEPSL